MPSYGTGWQKGWDIGIGISLIDRNTPHLFWRSFPSGLGLCGCPVGPLALPWGPLALPWAFLPFMPFGIAAPFGALWPSPGRFCPLCRLALLPPWVLFGPLASCSGLFGSLLGALLPSSCLVALFFGLRAFPVALFVALFCFVGGLALWLLALTFF